jgi:uncharacterized protein (UPF0264 family)
VSVRSAEEAAAALAGGADIIDIKEPSEGSLGRADASVIDDIVRLVRGQSPDTLVSAALGEVAETPATASPIVLPETPLNLVKCGLSGLLPDKNHWHETWRRFRQNHPVSHWSQWVAVSYADYERANAPAPLDVFKEGQRVGCPVMLVDTFVKDGTSLFDCLSPAELNELRSVTQASDMKLALAGQITAKQLTQVLTADPDIIAVRGAVCEDGDRGATVTADRVHDLVTALQQATSILATE